MRKKMIKKFLNRKSINSIVFAGLLFSITIISFLKKDTKFSSGENRELAQKPNISYDALLSGKLGKEYETYLIDQVFLRDSWITVKAQLDRMLGKREINHVFIGKKNYLIEKHTKQEIETKQFTKNIKRMAKAAKRYVTLLGNNHVKVMAVPTQGLILKDKLPLFAPDYNQYHILDSLKEQMQQVGVEESFLEVEEALFPHKEEYIYYKTDHHWTTLGAFYAYEYWINSIGMIPLSREDFEENIVSNNFFGTTYSKINIKLEADSIILFEKKEKIPYEVIYNMGEQITDTLFDLEQLEGKDKYSVFLKGNQPIVQVNTTIKNGRKLLIIKDSYANCFVPFAVNHFEQTHILDLRYVNIRADDYIKMYGITDVLILYNAINLTKDRDIFKLM